MVSETFERFRGSAKDSIGFKIGCMKEFEAFERMYMFVCCVYGIRLPLEVRNRNQNLVKTQNPSKGKSDVLERINHC